MEAPRWQITRPSEAGRWQITRNGVVIATDRSSALGIYAALRSLILDFDVAVARLPFDDSIKIDEETE